MDFQDRITHAWGHALGEALGRDGFWGRAATLNVRFSGPTESILDRLDIFSDATDLKNTLVLLFLRHLPPQRRSRKKHIFL